MLARQPHEDFAISVAQGAGNDKLLNLADLERGCGSGNPENTESVDTVSAEEALNRSLRFVV